MRPTKGRLRAVLKPLVLLMMLASSSACFKRPDFMIRVDPAVVPLVDASREEIAIRVASLESGLASGDLRGGAARDARVELQRLQKRLARGDFQVGDQMIVTVTRDEIVQEDTATVRDDLVIPMRGLPDASVAGVLRSELQPRLQTHVNRFLVDHRVRTNVLTRLQILGGVARPGFYGITRDRSITEVLALAGGPAPTANLDKVTVRRDGRLIVKPSMWRDAQRSGTTVASLGLQSGDVVEVELRKSRDLFMIVQVVAFGATALFGIISLLRVIYTEQE